MPYTFDFGVAKSPPSNPPFNGIIIHTGPQDSGKTANSLNCGVPFDRILVVDDDAKTGSIYGTVLSKGGYINMIESTAKMNELGLHDWMFALAEQIPIGRFDAIVWDTFSRAETAFHAYVNAHQSEFRIDLAPKGDIKGGQIWQEAGNYEARFLDLLRRKAPLVFLTAHLKDSRMPGPNGTSVLVPGKQVPNIRVEAQKKAVMRTVLLQSTGQYPIALFPKRLQRLMQTEQGLWEPQPVTAQRMPDFNWQHLMEYWNNPVGNRPPDPAKGEVPTEWEMRIMSATLSPDQEKAWLELVRLTVAAEQGLVGSVSPAPPALTLEQQTSIKAKYAEVGNDLFATIRAFPEWHLTPIQVKEVLA